MRSGLENVLEKPAGGCVPPAACRLEFRANGVLGKGKGCQVTGESQTVRQLCRLAAKLTRDVELRKDLVQEMFIHLVRVEADRPGQTPSWYLQSCQFRGRNYLNRGCSVDSIKRQNNLMPLGQSDDDGDDSFWFYQDAVDPMDLRSELITRDIVDLLIPQLTDAQQGILYLFMHGFGAREIARELRVSHPTVIKHRKKIARIASGLLADVGCIGSKRNSFVTLDPIRYDIAENREEMGNAARQHEDMPNRMVVREPLPGVETEPQGVGQTSNKQ
jgi:DNA-directed RNA polymerase specialized sigma24 family protein